MTKDEINEALRVRSGSVDIDGRLVSFLYTLMRDHLPLGTVEALVRRVELEGEGPNQYSNGYLARFAEDLAGRLVAVTEAPEVQPPVSELITMPKALELLTDAGLFCRLTPTGLIQGGVKEFEAGGLKGYEDPFCISAEGSGYLVSVMGSRRRASFEQRRGTLQGAVDLVKSTYADVLGSKPETRPSAETVEILAQMEEAFRAGIEEEKRLSKEPEPMTMPKALDLLTDMGLSCRLIDGKIWGNVRWVKPQGTREYAESFTIFPEKTGYQLTIIDVGPLGSWQMDLSETVEFMKRRYAEVTLNRAPAPGDMTFEEALSELKKAGVACHLRPGFREIHGGSKPVTVQGGLYAIQGYDEPFVIGEDLYGKFVAATGKGAPRGAFETLRRATNYIVSLYS